MADEKYTANECFEKFSRGTLKFNQGLDRVIFKPIAKGYRALPVPVRSGTANFVGNLRSLLTFTNNLLQGDFRGAGNTAGRFTINTTVGILGIFDPASKMGFEKKSREDFGQTLATWGSGEGPYVMLPLLGPSNPRDIVGRVLDFFIDPINWWSVTDSNEISIIRTGLGGIDVRNTYWEALEDIEKNSIDPYASYRSMYRQRRNDQIRNGAEMPTKSQSNLERELEISQPEIKDKS